MVGPSRAQQRQQRLGPALVDRGDFVAIGQHLACTWAAAARLHRLADVGRRLQGPKLGADAVNGIASAPRVNLLAQLAANVQHAVVDAFVAWVRHVRALCFFFSVCFATTKFGHNLIFCRLKMILQR